MEQADLDHINELVEKHKDNPWISLRIRFFEKYNSWVVSGSIPGQGFGSREDACKWTAAFLLKMSTQSPKTEDDPD